MPLGTSLLTPCPCPLPPGNLMVSFHKHCRRSLDVTFPLLHILPIPRSFYNTVNYGRHKTLNYRNYLVRNSNKRQMCPNAPYIAAQWQTLVLSAGGAAVAPATNLPAPTILVWSHSLTGIRRNSRYTCSTPPEVKVLKVLMTGQHEMQKTYA